MTYYINIKTYVPWPIWANNALDFALSNVTSGDPHVRWEKAFPGSSLIYYPSRNGYSHWYQVSFESEADAVAFILRWS